MSCTSVSALVINRTESEQRRCNLHEMTSACTDDWQERNSAPLPSWGADNAPWVGEALAASHGSNEHLIYSKSTWVLSTCIKYLFSSEKSVDYNKWTANTHKKENILRNNSSELQDENWPPTSATSQQNRKKPLHNPTIPWLSFWPGPPEQPSVPAESAQRLHPTI